METEWIPKNLVPCAESTKYSNAFVCEYKKEEIPTSDKFIIYSPIDLETEREHLSSNKIININGISPIELINRFCINGFCPIKKSDMSCINSIECPFEDIFDKTKIEILYLPKK